MIIPNRMRESLNYKGISYILRSCHDEMCKTLGPFILKTTCLLVLNDKLFNLSTREIVSHFHSVECRSAQFCMITYVLQCGHEQEVTYLHQRTKKLFSGNANSFDHN